MRITAVALVCALVLTLAVPVLAVDDSYVLTQEVYDTEGNLYQVYHNPSPSGSGYYYNYLYINGVAQAGLGLVFVGGYYYYVRSGGYLAYDSYYVSSTNDLLPAKTYTYDIYGRMVDPPSYPDDWESQWFDSDPTETVPPDTEPPDTEPPVTVPPATDPPASEPSSSIDTSADPGRVFGLFGISVAACSNWFVALMEGTGFGGVFLAMIFMWLLYKFLLIPLFGSGGSDRAKKKSEDK